MRKDKGNFGPGAFLRGIDRLTTWLYYIISASFIGRIFSAYATSGEIVETASDKIKTYLIGKSSSLAVCIESGRSSMVYRNRGDYANFHAFAFCNLGYGLEPSSIRSDTQHPISGLAAACYGSSGCC